MQEFWKLKFKVGRKFEGYGWFRGWTIRHRADNSIKCVTWRIRVLGKVVAV